MDGLKKLLLALGCPYGHDVEEIMSMPGDSRNKFLGWLLNCIEETIYKDRPTQSKARRNVVPSRGQSLAVLSDNQKMSKMFLQLGYCHTKSTNLIDETSVERQIYCYRTLLESLACIQNGSSAPHEFCDESAIDFEADNNHALDVSQIIPPDIIKEIRNHLSSKAGPTVLSELDADLEAENVKLENLPPIELPSQELLSEFQQLLSDLSESLSKYVDVHSTEFQPFCSVEKHNDDQHDLCLGSACTSLHKYLLYYLNIISCMNTMKNLESCIGDHNILLKKLLKEVKEA